MNYEKNEMTEIIDLFKKDMEKAGFEVSLKMKDSLVNMQKRS